MMSAQVRHNSQWICASESFILRNNFLLKAPAPGGFFLRSCNLYLMVISSLLGSQLQRDFMNFEEDLCVATLRHSFSHCLHTPEIWIPCRIKDKLWNKMVKGHEIAFPLGEVLLSGAVRWGYGWAVIRGLLCPNGGPTTVACCVHRTHAQLFWRRSFPEKTQRDLLI